MNLLGVKILAMALLGGLSLLVGLLPILLKSCCGFFQTSTSKSGSIILSCLSCFGGGVILATTFTHMLPEVNTFLTNNIHNGTFPETGMNFAEIFVLCGFFMIYICEELTHLLIDKYFAHSDPPKLTNANAEDVAMEAPLKNHCHEVPTDLLQVTDGNVKASLRGFVLILALSLHAIFEGIALGLAGSTSSVWKMFFAIAAHKYVISFCVGVQFVSSGIKVWLNILYISTFSLISPVGAGIGITLTETAATEASLQTSVVTVLQGIAAGTLLYVAFFEIIEKERREGTKGILIVTFLLLGFLSMVLIQFIEIATVGSHN